MIIYLRIYCNGYNLPIFSKDNSVLVVTKSDILKMKSFFQIRPFLDLSESYEQQQSVLHNYAGWLTYPLKTVEMELPKIPPGS